jgi:phosphoenolpyruvate carboxylase
MPSSNPIGKPEKNLPLRDDIRLLGRILGNTVREQEGEAVFGASEP